MTVAGVRPPPGLPASGGGQRHNQRQGVGGDAHPRHPQGCKGGNGRRDRRSRPTDAVPPGSDRSTLECPGVKHWQCRAKPLPDFISRSAVRVRHMKSVMVRHNRVVRWKRDRRGPVGENRWFLAQKAHNGELPSFSYQGLHKRFIHSRRVPEPRCDKVQARRISTQCFVNLQRQYPGGWTLIAFLQASFLRQLALVKADNSRIGDAGRMLGPKAWIRV